MLRVIGEIRPAWVVGENVFGIVSMALDTVLSDLEGIGYPCRAFVIPACAVNAPHRRDRVCIVAHDDGERRQELSSPTGCGEAGITSRSDAPKPESGGGGTDTGVPEPDMVRVAYGVPTWVDADQIQNRWNSEQGIARVKDGEPDRVKRITALGNSVVPMQFYPFFKFIADIEKGMS